MRIANSLTIALFILCFGKPVDAAVTDVSTDIPQPAPLARNADVTFDRFYKHCENTKVHDPDAYCQEALDSGLNSDLDGCKYVSGNSDTPMQDGNSCILRCRYQKCPRLNGKFSAELIDSLWELEALLAGGRGY